MADLIPFPIRLHSEDRFQEVRVIGAESGIVIRIMSRVASPHDLMIVLDGTFEGCTTVASIPAEEMAIAETMAYSILATLEAAEITWSLRKTASG